MRIQYPGRVFPPFFGPETTTVDRWHKPLSEPPKAKTSILTADQPFFFYPLPQAQETVSVDRWLQPLSTPTRRIGLDVSQQSSIVIPFGAIQGQSLTISQVAWHWTPHALSVNQQQQITISLVTWHWVANALTVTSGTVLTFIRANWHWKGRPFAGYFVPGIRGDVIRGTVVGCVKAVIKSVVSD